MKFKKLVIGSLVFLLGCSSGTGNNQSGENSGGKGADSPVVWVHTPDMKLSGIYELQADSYWGIGDTTFNEKLGYPQEWDDTYKPEYQEYGDMAKYRSAPEFYTAQGVEYYNPDSIGVSVGENQGVYNYSGEALIKPFPAGNNYSGNPSKIEYFPWLGFALDTSTPDYHTVVFNKDFKYTSAAQNVGIGGDPGAGYYIIDGVLYNNMEVITEPTIIDAHGHNCLVNIATPAEPGSYFPYDKIIGTAAYTKDAEFRHSFEGLFPLVYVNGFCTFSDKESAYYPEVGRWVNDGNLVIYNMTTFEPIAEGYEETKWFESGFCPVKKDGKWGFIDETGKAVTDFIWDEVSTLYEGKAYVGINGVYGIINIPETLNKGVELTMETCYPNGVPEGIDAELGTLPDISIGTITVKVDNLNTRSEPGTYGEKCGKLISGTKYPVYEIQSDSEYTWYRIAEHVWSADKNGEWLDYTENAKG